MKVKNIIEKFYNFFDGFGKQEKYVREATEKFFTFMIYFDALSGTELVKITIQHIIDTHPEEFNPNRDRLTQKEYDLLKEVLL